MSNNSSDKLIQMMLDMQEQVSELKDKLEIMENVIQQQSAKLNSYNEVFYYLIGGLFNHTTQPKTFINYMETIFGDLNEDEKEHYKNITNSSRWRDLPTTRQGDENEQRIECLEEKLNTILGIIQQNDDTQNQYIQKEETATQKSEDICYSIVSSSSHSSMPDLIECSDTIDSNNLSMQNSMEYSDTSSISSSVINDVDYVDDIDDSFDW
jgi:hypothetical protein